MTQSIEKVHAPKMENHTDYNNVVKLLQIDTSNITMKNVSETADMPAQLRTSMYNTEKVSELLYLENDKKQSVTRVGCILTTLYITHITDLSEIVISIGNIELAKFDANYINSNKLYNNEYRDYIVITCDDSFYNKVELFQCIANYNPAKRNKIIDKSPQNYLHINSLNTFLICGGIPLVSLDCQGLYIKTKGTGIVTADFVHVALPVVSLFKIAKINIMLFNKNYVIEKGTIRLYVSDEVSVPSIVPATKTEFWTRIIQRSAIE
jgi:hypothetical protein